MALKTCQYSRVIPAVGLAVPSEGKYLVGEMPTERAGQDKRSDTGKEVLGERSKAWMLVFSLEVL